MLDDVLGDSLAPENCLILRDGTTVVAVERLELLKVLGFPALAGVGGFPEKFPLDTVSLSDPEDWERLDLELEVERV